MTAGLIAELDDEMSLQALPRYGATPTSPMNVEKAWLAVERLTLYLSTACLLNEYDALESLLKAPFVPMEHDSHWIFHKETFHIREKGSD